MKKTFTILSLLICTLISCEKQPELTDKEIIAIGLDELGLEDVYIMNKDIEPEVSIQDDNYALEGYVTGHSGQYIMRIKAGQTQRKRIAIIAHELVHIKQLQTRELIVDSPGIIFRGKPYHVNYIEYDRRPWETAAFQQGALLEKLINKEVKKNY